MALDEMAEHAEGCRSAGWSWTVGQVRGGGVRTVLMRAGKRLGVRSPRPTTHQARAKG